MSVSRLLAALGAVGGVLLGLQTIGVKPIAPGLDTGFRTSRGCENQEGLCLETDAGDLSVLVSLWIRNSGDSVGTWHAELGDGTRLDVTPVETGKATWHLKIEKPDTIPGASKFKWPNGIALYVWNGRGSLRLVKWRVYPEKASYDSQARERWRTIWSGGMLLFLVVGIIAAVTGMKSNEPEDLDTRVLAAHLVRKTISEVHGDSQEETENIQRLLKRVLLGTVPVEVALNQVTDGGSRLRQIMLWFKARHGFRLYYDKLLDLLNDYRNELDEFSAPEARTSQIH